jgi:hypothetical protein
MSHCYHNKPQKFSKSVPGEKKKYPGGGKKFPPLCPGEKISPPCPGKKKFPRGRKKFHPLCPGEKFPRGKKKISLGIPLITLAMKISSTNGYKH